MISIGKVFRFEAAHQLPNHSGKCRNLHGHSYKLEIDITGPINFNEGASDEGMVMDFANLKAIVAEKVIDVVDHQFLNDVIPAEFQPTTAENICRWIILQIWPNLPEDIETLAVRLWETETSYAEIVMQETEDHGR